METAPTAANRWIAAGAASAFLAVGFGAFGAHALRNRIPPGRLEIFETGEHYHLIHSIALILIGMMLGGRDFNARLLWAAGLMLLGIILFSGSLYVLAATGIRAMGAITPFGGVSCLAAWALLFVAVVRRPPQNP